MGNVLTTHRQESIWNRRGALAFALAPLAPVLAYSMFTSENFLGSMMFGAVIAYAHMLVLGFPLTAWANLRRRISLLTCALGGTSIGLFPWLVFMSWSMLRSPGPMGGKAVVAMFFSFSFFGSMGFIAGIAFWGILVFKGPSAVVKAQAQ